jgi:hypothetical protein
VALTITESKNQIFLKKKRKKEKEEEGIERYKI